MWTKFNQDQVKTSQDKPMGMTLLTSKTSKQEIKNKAHEAINSFIKCLVELLY